MSSRLILNCPNGHITETDDLERYGFNQYTMPGPQKGPFVCEQCLDAVQAGNYHGYVSTKTVVTTKIIATCSCGEVTESEPYMSMPSKPCKNSLKHEEGH